MADRDVIMLGSNNYLGMTENPIVKKKTMEALEEYGVGTTGSRLLNGTFKLHVELEKQLAEFLGKKDCMIFSTGMQANLGALSALISKKEEWVLSDEFNHASTIDGLSLTKMNKEQKIIFKHNDMNNLEDKIRKIETIPINREISFLFFSFFMFL